MGAIGKPSLALLADHTLKTPDLWFWFGAVVSFAYLPLLSKCDPDFHTDYMAVAKMAQEVAPWPTKQFNRVPAQEQAGMQQSKLHAFSTKPPRHEI